jgi:hypothetical protein
MSTPTPLRIPYGVADFVKVRRGNEYSVDKTAYLPLLEEAGRFLFLIRPRRFGNDRDAKFQHYRTLPSLRDYLLVAQTECRVEHYVREAGRRWLLTDYRDLDAMIDLTSVSCRLHLREMYERVPL